MKTLPTHPGAPLSLLELEKARAREPKCTRCSLSNGVRTPCLPAELHESGGEAGTLLVIGESPGEHEDRQARPFVSQTGLYVRDQVKRYWKGATVFDYALRCFTGANKVDEAQFAACRGFGRMVLDQAAPARVLLLGDWAVRSVLGRYFQPESVRRGYVMLGPNRDIPAFFLLRPNLMNRVIRGWFESDLEWACTALPPRASADQLTLEQGVVHVIETVEDSLAAVEALRGEDLVLDTETFGQLYNDDFMVLNLCVAAVGSVDAYEWNGAALYRPDVLAPIKKLLEHGGVRKVGQHAKFDHNVLRVGVGVTVRGWHGDTLLWRKLLQADAAADLGTMQSLVGMAGGKDDVKPVVDQAKRDLRKLVAKPGCTVTSNFGLDPQTMAGVLAAVARGVEPVKYAYAAIPDDMRAAYCARDTISTGLLAERFETELTGMHMWPHWENVVRPLALAVAEMEFNGVYIDRPAVHALQVLMAGREAELRVRLATYGSFNPNTPKEVGDLLYGKLGIPVRSTTGKGAPSTDAAALEAISHPAAQDILAYRRAVRFKGQYADAMEWEIRADGRIHPHIQIAGTVSGRPSCTEPNLMNIPSPDTPEGKMCRDIFAAAPGKVILEGDYSQIELRVAAMLAEDEVMIDLFRQGMDFHLATAKLIAPMFDLHPDEITKEHPLRGRAKTTNFGVLYGMDAYGLSKALSSSKAVAQKLIDAIFGRFKKLKLWIDGCLAFARRSGFCRTWWDGKDARVRPLPLIIDPYRKEDRETQERASWNTPVQGTAAEFTNASLGRIQETLQEEGLESKLILTVYDSIMLECPSDELEEVAGHCERIMTGWNSNGVPMGVEFKRGLAWGSMEKYRVGQ